MNKKMLPLSGKLKLSVGIATRNEEENIERCLQSVKNIADEIIIFDEYSTDKTVEIAKKYGANVFLEPHHDIFHITKQKTIEKSKGEWILQLDADEVVSKELGEEILKLVNGGKINDVTNPLFIRHQKIVQERDGKIGTNNGEVTAFFIPRRNMFLGKPLIHGGVYPDAVIRLFKNKKANWPCVSVHEQMKIEGRVGWLNSDLLHYDSPTLKRYLMRLNRYTDLQAEELKADKTSKNLLSFLKFTLLLPIYYFLLRYVRHKGFLDGVNGFLWAFFSATHFPIAYFKYLTNEI